jgi:hypothetical protein
MRKRGLAVDHTAVFRWVQRYAPEINRRIRPHLKLAGASYRVLLRELFQGARILLTTLTMPRSGRGSRRTSPVPSHLCHPIF